MKIKKAKSKLKFIFKQAREIRSLFAKKQRNDILGNKVWSNARYLIRNFAFEANKIDLNFFTSEKVSTCFSFFYLFSNLESISILPLFHFCYRTIRISLFDNFQVNGFSFYYISRPLICFLLNKTYYIVNTIQIKYMIYIYTQEWTRFTINIQSRWHQITVYSAFTKWVINIIQT